MANEPEVEKKKQKSKVRLLFLHQLALILERQWTCQNWISASLHWPECSRAHLLRKNKESQSCTEKQLTQKHGCLRLFLRILFHTQRKKALLQWQTSAGIWITEQDVHVHVHAPSSGEMRDPNVRSSRYRVGEQLLLRSCVWWESVLAWTAKQTCGYQSSISAATLPLRSFRTLQFFQSFIHFKTKFKSNEYLEME